MASTKPGARFWGLTGEPGRGTCVDDLAGIATRYRCCETADIDDADPDCRTRCETAGCNRCRLTLFEGAARRFPCSKAAIENRHRFMAEQAHHPPAAGGCLYVRIVIEHDMVIIADAKRGDAFGEEVGRGDHMRHGVALVGNGVNVEPLCPGDMSS